MSNSNLNSQPSSQQPATNSQPRLQSYLQQQQQQQQHAQYMSDPILQARLAFMAQQQQNSIANGADNRTGMSQEQVAAMTAAMGNMQGSNREAIMKQLQALQNSQTHRNKIMGQMNSASQSGQPGAPSPAGQQQGMTAPSPSGSAQHEGYQRPALSHSGSNESTGQSQPDQIVGGMPMSQQQRDLFLAQQQRLLQQQSTNQQSQSPQQSNPGQPPLSRSAMTAMHQRQTFLNTYTMYFRSTGQQLPPEIFNNGEKEGAFRVGDAWVDVIDLLMAVLKCGGIMNAMQQPSTSPIWQNLLTLRNIPNPLPRPLPTPRPANDNSNAPLNLTTDPVQYLISAYLAWVYGFETHMQKSRQASYARQHQSAIAAGKPPPPPPPMPTVAGLMKPSVSSESPAEIQSSLPPSPATSATATTYPPPAGHTAPSPAESSRGAPRPRKKKEKKDLSVNTSIAGGQVDVGTPTDSAGAKKRKKGKNGMTTGQSGMTSTSTPMSDTAYPPSASDPNPEPSEPAKRARYRVEYRPIHVAPQNLVGWDPAMISASFPKNSLRQGTRPIHDLQVVDMEAILMSLRSRMPKELGYAVTVLAMLSMPHPEENINGLPLHHLKEVFVELLDLVEESIFGEEGYGAWLKDGAAGDDEQVKMEEGEAGEKSRGMDDLNKMPFIELEKLGKDFDFAVFDDEDEYRSRKETTGGSTNIVLACINILRNFSMLPENQEFMASFPQLINLLAIVSDARLGRLPGEATSVGSSPKPFSIIELARIRRDCVTVFVNIGDFVQLRRATRTTSLSLFRLLSTFIASGWTSNSLSEPVYGPTLGVSVRELGPPATSPSTDRALAAFSVLARSDSNREILGSVVPHPELVELYYHMLKLLPITKRHFESMHTLEESLGYYETLALSLYSLAFLSPLPARTSMRAVPGSLTLITRIIFDTALQKSDYRTSPFSILCRRLSETLGVLNGTVSPAGTVEGPSGMGFGAGGVEGSGWKFASGRVERGWLAGSEEAVLGAILGVKGMNWAAMGELDGMLWGGD